MGTFLFPFGEGEGDTRLSFWKGILETSGQRLSSTRVSGSSS